MKFRTLLKIALKSLFGKKLRSLLTIGGVAVGIAAIVFLVSLGFGVQDLIIKKVTGLDALRIIDVSTVKSQLIKINDDSLGQFRNFKEVETVEPLINIPGRIKFGGSSTDVVAYGATTEYMKMASVKVQYGQNYKNDGDQIIVNTAVLKLIGIKEGEYDQSIGKEAEVELVISKDLLNEEKKSVVEGESLSSIKKMTIAGVISDAETPYVFVPFQNMKDQGIVVYSQAKVKVKNQNQLDQVRNNLESLGFSTNSASDTVKQIDQIFSIFRIILAAFGSIALIVAALGMFNTLTVSLLERTREVGLMKALGAKRKDVFSIFLCESLAISIIGGTLGILLGYGIGEGVNFGLNRLASMTGNEAVDVFQTPFYFIGFIILFSFVIGILTGLYPSRRASRINPLDALRYE